MHLDVAELRDFYTRPLGLLVRRLLAHRIRARWRRITGETLIGLGFATPYLGAFRGEALRLGALMPAAQGALVWPATGSKMSALVEEDHLPLPDNCVDRLLAVHCLETAERVRPVLREMWRVLTPEGRLLMIVPNRRSVWARFDTTPFGHGRPYSRSQLQQLLADALFTPLDWSMALHVPPLERPIVLRSATAFERVGARLSPAFGGVIIVEARKELMAPIGKVATARRLGRLVTAGGGNLSHKGACATPIDTLGLAGPEGVRLPRIDHNDPSNEALETRG
jgi:SAM-dependent methyltransferase